MRWCLSLSPFSFSAHFCKMIYSSLIDKSVSFCWAILSVIVNPMLSRFSAIISIAILVRWIWIAAEIILFLVEFCVSIWTLIVFNDVYRLAIAPNLIYFFLVLRTRIHMDGRFQGFSRCYRFFEKFLLRIVQHVENKVAKNKCSFFSS